MAQLPPAFTSLDAATIATPPATPSPTSRPPCSTSPTPTASLPPCSTSSMTTSSSPCSSATSQLRPLSPADLTPQPVPTVKSGIPQPFNQQFPISTRLSAQRLEFANKPPPPQSSPADLRFRRDTYARSHIRKNTASFLIHTTSNCINLGLKGRRWVAKSLDFNKDYEACVFETTIRVVGGLLSAYDLSNDKVFLEMAKDIADRLLPAWDTPSGVPYNTINLANGRPHNPGWTSGDSILADSGTEQLEFIALSQRTGDPKYQQKAENVIAALNKTFPDDGLLPIYINPDNSQASPSTITFGAMGDSFYEYLLKVWIQGNRTAAVRPYRKKKGRWWRLLLEKRMVAGLLV